MLRSSDSEALLLLVELGHQTPEQALLRPYELLELTGTTLVDLELPLELADQLVGIVPPSVDTLDRHVPRSNVTNVALCNRVTPSASGPISAQA